MAVATVANALTTAVVKAAPSAKKAVWELVDKATGGKVKRAEDIASYVGKDQNRATAVLGAVIRGGVDPDVIFTNEIVGNDARMQALQLEARALAQEVRAKAKMHEDTVIPGETPREIAEDIARLTRVQAILDQYGSEHNYRLCHPEGSIPSNDFAYYTAVRLVIRRGRA